MNKLHISKKIYIPVAILIIIVLCVIARIAYAPTHSQHSHDVDGEVSLRGTSVCLPHLDTSGPQTMECAIGLKTEDGTYYALAGQSSATMSGTYPEKLITVEGTLRKETSTVYQSKGTITVSKIIE